MDDRTLALRVAPQRATQYQQLASVFAEPEIRRSPLGPHVTGLERRHVGDAEYVVLELADGVAPVVDATLPVLSATSDAFWIEGSSWHPVAVSKRTVVPRTMIETRRYQGKTNELFTRLLVNLALFGRLPDAPARLLDPMCGGGTTVFAALERGASAVGADAEASVVAGTARFLKKFAGEHGIGCRVTQEHHKGKGRDWHHELKTTPGPLRCSLLQSDVADLVERMEKIPGGLRCHAVVGDLPYGIQHPGTVVELLGDLLDVVDATLTGDGVAVFAWNASRVGREVLEDAVGDRFSIDDTADLAHRVDRAIKRREVLVLRRPSPVERATPADG